MSPWAAAGLGLLGNFLLSLGMALQKRHIGWIGRKNDGSAEYRGDRRGWAFGFVLINLVPIFNYLALLGLPPSLVAAMTGTSVAFTSLLAALLLKERPGGLRLLWTALLFGALAIAGFREGAMGEGLAPGWLYAAAALPFTVGIALLGLRRMRAARGMRSAAGLATAIAAAAGASGGFMVLAMRALQLTAHGGFVAWLATPYLYLYALSGGFALVLIQIAYKDGELSVVSPALYGTQVLWPALVSHPAFGVPFDPVQSAALVAVGLAVVGIAGAPSGPQTRAKRP